MVKNKPTILMAVGLTAVTSSVVLSVVGTHKAEKAIAKKKEELNKNKLTLGEVIKASWKYYIPAAVTLVGGGACIIAGNRVSTNRQMAVAAAYAASETALTTYKEAAKEVLTPTQEKKVSDAADRKVVAQAPIEGEYDKAIICTNGGDTLFFDELTSRYFKSSINKLEKEMNYLNKLAIPTSNPTTLNEWYESIGLPGVADGYERGWCYDYGNGDLLEIDTTHADVTESGVPYIMLKYRKAPKPL